MPSMCAIPLVAGIAENGATLVIAAIGIQIIATLRKDPAINIAASTVISSA